MSVRAPHYLLFSEARQRSKPLFSPDASEQKVSTTGSRGPSSSRRISGTRKQGAWRFVLESVEGEDKFEALDEEPEVSGDRLELLAVVRGLEALDQPSRVTLVTRSPYVARGFRFGLNEWRENDWRWEHYGEYTQVQNHDLWQRVDRAMSFHKVECRIWRFDSAHAESESAASRQGGLNETGRQSSHPDRGGRQADGKPGNSRAGWVGRLFGRVRSVFPGGRRALQHQ